MHSKSTDLITEPVDSALPHAPAKRPVRQKSFDGILPAEDDQRLLRSTPLNFLAFVFFFFPKMR